MNDILLFPNWVWFCFVFLLLCSASKGIHFIWLQILLAQKGEKVLGNMKNKTYDIRV